MRSWNASAEAGQVGATDVVVRPPREKRWPPELLASFWSSPVAEVLQRRERGDVIGVVRITSGSAIPMNCSVHSRAWSRSSAASSVSHALTNAR